MRNTEPNLRTCVERSEVSPLCRSLSKPDFQSKRRGYGDGINPGKVSHSAGTLFFVPASVICLSRRVTDGGGYLNPEDTTYTCVTLETVRMLNEMRNRYHSAQRRLRRLERRELRELRRWLEDTENLLHLSSLVTVPLLIGAVTLLSNVSPAVSFLVYPPLASGTYTLFADPGGRYSSPRKFVGGMTVGALSGWIALEVSARLWYAVPPEQFQVNAAAATLGIFLTGVVTWGFDLEEPTAFSSALLVLVTGSEELAYVGGIAVSSLLVAGVFVA